MASVRPSKLHGTMKVPDLMPSKAILATLSAFIEPEEAASILVNSGLVLFLAKGVGVRLDSLREASDPDM
ncbi:hypothetical protein COLO4_12800 [Corchorus olitorius]|uniref:Uncharacterized protein n=1 Tax=Corchorus olitorius TaxID=93759 RepID=A0A1R3JZI5_9ROSI|nr:hypothetical protein COLO4_12800 [Corchorus olitorius]